MDDGLLGFLSQHREEEEDASNAQQRPAAYRATLDNKPERGSPVSSAHHISSADSGSARNLTLMEQWCPGYDAGGMSSEPSASRLGEEPQGNPIFQLKRSQGKTLQGDGAVSLFQSPPGSTVPISTRKQPADAKSSITSGGQKFFIGPDELEADGQLLHVVEMAPSGKRPKHERPLPAKEPLPPAAVEKERIRVRAAEKLYALIGPDMEAPGTGTSRIPAKAMDPIAFKMAKLISQGGSSGAKNDILRLFLENWTEFGSQEGVDLEKRPFPITADDALLCLLWLSGPDGNLNTTAVGRMGDALAYARHLGLEVAADMSCLDQKRARVRGAPPGSNARDTPPPLALISLLLAAHGALAGTEQNEPLIFWARSICFDFFLNARGCDLHSSVVIAPCKDDKECPEDVIHTVNGVDKNDRAEVHQWCPALEVISQYDTETGTIDWFREHVRVCAGQKFSLPEWVPAKEGDKSVANATELRKDKGGNLVYCAQKKVEDWHAVVTCNLEFDHEISQ